VAVEEDRFHFAPDLAEREAMSKALLGYRRQVRDDGFIGSELVVALLLTLRPLPPVIEIMVALTWVRTKKRPALAGRGCGRHAAGGASGCDGEPWASHARARWRSG